jgi:hypothetical protein
MALFSTKELFKEAFGLHVLRRFPDAGKAEPQSAMPEYGSIQVVTAEEVKATSMLGTPVLAQLSIEPGSYTLRENGVAKTIAYEGYTFPSTIIIEVERNKDIVKTKVAGRDYTVKELISWNDYAISIKGIVASPPDRVVYPESEVRALRAIADVPAALKVNSRLLALLGINNIVIERLSLPARDGWVNVQVFTIDAVSDESIPLRTRRGMKR